MTVPWKSKAPRNQRVSVERDVLELCAYANDRLRVVGFERVAVSLKTESTYWRWPGRTGVIRVSSHKHGGDVNGLDAVLAKITFRGGPGSRHVISCSDDYVENMITWAVGRYLLDSREESS